MKYRRDIDGLRSVAVLSVIAYHYFPPILHGGFIGVDIFFVISGYLISGIIFGEIGKDDFSILRFYRRRINRIFPALICVLLVSLGLGWLILFPDEFRSLGKNAVASAAFLENIYLWMQSGYFDADSLKKPLLHIWSLGVEEQFYIIYPPMLLVAHRLGLLGEKFLIACCLASFVASAVLIGHAPSADFYMPFTRYWELAVGGILAWREHERSRGLTPTDWLRGAPPALLSGIGFVAVAAGFFLIDARTPFPGTAVVLPVLGAALIIASGPQAMPNRMLLSNRAAVFVGKISYPLYLWHWPLLAFLYIVTIEKPEPPVRLVLVALTFVLATLTWLVVETPIRTRYNNARTSAVLFVVMCGVAVFGWVIAQSGGFPERAVNRMNAGVAVQASGIDSPPLPVHDCTVRADVARLFRNCIQDRNRPARFVLLGDSKADALYDGLARSAPAGGNWLFLGGADATSFGAPEPLISDNPAWARVQSQSRAAIDFIAHDPDIRVVLYAAAARNVYLLDDNGGAGRIFNSYDHRFLKRLKGTQLEAPARDAVMAAVSQLTAAGKTVAILADNPPLPVLRSCNGRLTASGTMNTLLGLHNGNLDPDCIYAKSQFRDDARIYFDMLAHVKQAFGDKVIILDYTDFYCQMNGGKVCGTALDGNAIYGYTDHISSMTANMLGRSINQQLEGFARP